jgi:hypothetical protein
MVCLPYHYSAVIGADFIVITCGVLFYFLEFFCSCNDRVVL